MSDPTGLERVEDDGGSRTIADTWLKAVRDSQPRIDETRDERRDREHAPQKK